MKVGETIAGIDEAGTPDCIARGRRPRSAAASRPQSRLPAATASRDLAVKPEDLSPAVRRLDRGEQARPPSDPRHRPERRV